MPSFENTGSHELLKRVYAAKTADESREAYDEWASRYDEDIAAQDYVAPTIIARAVVTHDGNINGAILDAGCGTGLTGAALAQAGAKTIDGLDFSPGMLGVAEKTGAYRNLSTADLSKPIDAKGESYDVVTCVGTLTKGHVGPSPALAEFLRITKPEGVVAVTILDDVYESDGHKAEIEKLQSGGLIEVLQNEQTRIGGRNGVDIQSRIVVLRKK